MLRRVALFAVALLSLVEVAEARRVALVIGQDAYPGGASATVGLPKLHNPVRDARRMAELSRQARLRGDRLRRQDGRLPEPRRKRAPRCADEARAARGGSGSGARLLRRSRHGDGGGQHPGPCRCQGRLHHRCRDPGRADRADHGGDEARPAQARLPRCLPRQPTGRRLPGSQGQEALLHAHRGGRHARLPARHLDAVRPVRSRRVAGHALAVRRRAVLRTGGQSGHLFRAGDERGGAGDLRDGAEA